MYGRLIIRLLVLLALVSAPWLAYHAWRAHAATQQLAILIDGTDIVSIESYIRQGADVRGVSREGDPFIGYAAAWGSADLVRYMLERGADPNAIGRRPNLSPLQSAACTGDPEKVRLLVEAGADLEYRRSESGDTALHLAVGGGRLHAAAALLEAGADPNATNHYGSSVLAIASRLGELDAMRLLIRYGALVNPASPSDPTQIPPLEVAVRRPISPEAGLAAAVLLLEAGAKPPDPDSPAGRLFSEALQTNFTEAQRRRVLSLIEAAGDGREPLEAGSGSQGGETSGRREAER